MKRVIKFRSWDGHTMEDVDCIINGRPTFWDIDSQEYMEFDGTLMQFTGLLDKNGKEIYEGDIVKFRTSPSHTPYAYTKAQVVFEHGRFEPLPGYTHSDDLSDFENTHYEVIGNIYENKDSL